MILSLQLELYQHFEEKKENETNERVMSFLSTCSNFTANVGSSNNACWLFCNVGQLLPDSYQLYSRAGFTRVWSTHGCEHHLVPCRLLLAGCRSGCRGHLRLFAMWASNMGFCFITVCKRASPCRKAFQSHVSNHSYVRPYILSCLVLCEWEANHNMFEGRDCAGSVGLEATLAPACHLGKGWWHGYWELGRSQRSEMSMKQD